MQTPLWQDSLDELASKGFVLCPHILPDAVIESLKQRAQKEHEEGLFSKARVGQGPMKKASASLRGDHIRWIEDWHSESLKPVHALFTELQMHLRQFLFLPIQRFESHLAYYEPGSFYVRHRDRHRYHPSRIITAVIHLNTLGEANGGELCLYHKGKEIRIRPEQGRLCLFLSEIEHEVFKTEAPRWSLTTWFRDDLVADLHLRPKP